jgi:phage shock protein PspC (stress-responsive transcriptional regulator)
MNKTVSIHLQGVPFILEEQAFDRLNSYMLQLKQVLQKEEGSDEIIQDIELRMVELIQQKLTPFKQVVEISVIEQIIEKLGQPEVFSDENAATNETTSVAQDDVVEKRLFRDGDRALIGGVCAGVSAYFNVDVIIIRAIYIFTFLTFGIGFLMYLVLWAIIPLAKTSSDKLRMKGQHVTIENMKSELEDAANRIKKGAKDMEIKKGIQSTVGGVLRILSMIIGIWALLLGTGIFVCTIIFFFVNPNIIPAQINGRFMSFQDFGRLLFESAAQESYFNLGIGMISIALVAQCYLLGIRLMTRFKGKYLKVLTAIFGVTLVVGVILVSLGGVQIGRSMAIYGEVEKEIATISGTELNLEKKSIEGKLIKGFKIKSNGDQGLITVKNGRVYLRGIELIYTQSSDSLFHIKQLNDAQGSSHETALKKARNITCYYELLGNQMLLETMYSFPITDKFRDQNVKFTICVPSGGKIFYDKQQVYPRFKQEMDALNETYQHGYIESDGSYSNW